MSSRFSILGALALLFVTVAAHADVAKARLHYERGTQAFNLQDFKTALDEFKQAYVEQPDPVFLFNIAQAQRQLGAYDAAAKSYRLYLANRPDAPNHDQVARLIEQMDEAAREARAKEPPTGTQAPASTPTPTPEPAPAATTAPPVEVVDTGKSMRIAGIVTADVGVGLVALGAIFAGLSYQAGNDAYHPANGIYDHAADERQTNYRNGEIACFVIGGAAAAVGTTIWMLGRKRRETRRPTTALVPAAGRSF
jgi:tetratricopeptide (TPR) repeat protein